MKQITVTLKELDNQSGSGGLEIIIPEAKGNPADDPKKPIPVFIEYYDKKLQVHIWDGTSQDPQTITLELQTACPKGGDVMGTDFYGAFV